MGPHWVGLMELKRHLLGAPQKKATEDGGQLLWKLNCPSSIVIIAPNENINLIVQKTS